MGKVNAFDAHMEPPTGGAAVCDYLAAVCRALNLRSDSALARMMGVAPSTLGSWKTRGAVPEEHAAWFRNNLISKIVARNDDLPMAGLTARAAVMELMMRTGGNPLDVARLRITVNATMLAPLLAVAQFLVECEGVDPQILRSTDVEQVADLLEGARAALRRSLSSEVLGEVSQ